MTLIQQRTFHSKYSECVPSYFKKPFVKRSKHRNAVQMDSQPIQELEIMHPRDKVAYSWSCCQN